MTTTHERPRASKPAPRSVLTWRGVDAAPLRRAAVPPSLRALRALRCASMHAWVALRMLLTCVAGTAGAQGQAIGGATALPQAVTPPASSGPLGATAAPIAPVVPATPAQRAASAASVPSAGPAAVPLRRAPNRAVAPLAPPPAVRDADGRVIPGAQRVSPTQAIDPATGRTVPVLPPAPVTAPAVVPMR